MFFVKQVSLFFQKKIMKPFPLFLIIHHTMIN
jgi:hypothetical protein